MKVSESPAITFTGVSKRFDVGSGGLRVQALEGFSWSVPAGSWCGVMGANGSGKSTALKVALGLLQPDAGECKIGGRRAGSRVARAQIGYLADGGGVPLHLTAREGLGWWGQLRGGTRRTALERAAEWLDAVGLTAAADRRAHTYSKGMRQRLALAQALMTDPAILILDEPFAGIDPFGVRELSGLLGRLRAAGKTILFSSHLLDQVAAQCDRVVMLHHGRRVAEGRPADWLGPSEGEANRSGRRRLDDVFMAHVRGETTT